MGSNTSKVTNEAAVQLHKNDSETNSDPRSPTPEISRTPLQGKGGSKHNITKNVDLRKTFEDGVTEEKLIHNNPILSAVIKNHLQSYDPRSPTQDFERTPIVILQNAEEIKNIKSSLRAQSMANHGSPCLLSDNNHNESNSPKESSPDIVPKKLCNGLLNLTFDDTIKDVPEPLGSSTASSDSIEKNAIDESIDKPTKLLETNFDYDEFNDSFENITESTEHIITSKKSNVKIENKLKYNLQFKILPEDPRSPTNGIERTPIVVAKREEISDSKVEEMSDDTLIKVLQNTNANIMNGLTKSHRNHSDEILIYEDEANSLVDTPKKAKSTSSSESRTPLSCMKNKADAVHNRSKSANTLYDPKSQNIAGKKVSHIPRLKSLTKPSKFIPTASSISLRNMTKATVVVGDCENTPPHSHRDKWDKDTSIVL